MTNESRSDILFATMTDDERHTLYDFVDEAIHNLICELPEEVRKEAEKVPCYLDGVSFLKGHPEALGCCMQYLENSPIFIFVENIHQVTGGNLNGTLASARQVYMHELGHVLGLGEVEVRERGI